MNCVQLSDDINHGTCYTHDSMLIMNQSSGESLAMFPVAEDEKNSCLGEDCLKKCFWEFPKFFKITKAIYLIHTKLCLLSSLSCFT
jgi:hypothetical protein